MTILTGNSAVEPHLREQFRVGDTASELLVAELALNDLVAVQATRKGKAHEDARSSDRDIALDLQAASLRKQIDVLRDHQLASSIDRAIECDAGQLRRLGLVEQAEYDDHSAAIALRDGHDFPRQTLSQRMVAEGLVQLAREPSTPHHASGRASNATQADMETLNAGIENVHISNPVRLEAVSRQSRNVERKVECVICGDDVTASRAFRAPNCGHHYCRSCIANLVEASLRDEGLYPLRCCHQSLPLWSGVFKYISTSLRTQFLFKSREYSVPTGSRVYCSNPRCSVFLDSSGDEKRDLTCSECNTLSCSKCRNNAHPGEGCFEHQSLLELRETATANKWQTCPGCDAIVELSQGCYHMTCRCSTQFCYLCSARWKTCDCRQWDEERLLDDANRRVRNEFGDRAAEAQPAVHAERVYQRMEALREDHECRGHFWMYRNGSGNCEECGDSLYRYLMRCANCHALVCRRCSINRL